MLLHLALAPRSIGRHAPLALFRRSEEALVGTAMERPVTEALLALIDAIFVFPGNLHGAISVRLRRDLAAFLHAGAAKQLPTICSLRSDLPVM